MFFLIKSLHFMKEKIKPRTIKRSIPKWIYYTTAVLRNRITWNSFFVFLHRTSLMGGKASDRGLWGRCSGQPVRKKSLGVLCSWSFLLQKLKADSRPLASVRPRVCPRACTCVCPRACTCVCLALQTRSHWRTKGNNLIQHSERQFNFLVSGLDPSFEVWERVGENKHFFIDLHSNIRFSLQKRVWNHLGYLESQTSGVALWEAPTGKNSEKSWIIQVPWTKKLFY